MSRYWLSLRGGDGEDIFLCEPGWDGIQCTVWLNETMGTGRANLYYSLRYFLSQGLCTIQAWLQARQWGCLPGTPRPKEEPDSCKRVGFLASSQSCNVWKQPLYGTVVLSQGRKVRLTGLKRGTRQRLLEFAKTETPAPASSPSTEVGSVPSAEGFAPQSFPILHSPTVLAVAPPVTGQSPFTPECSWGDQTASLQPAAKGSSRQLPSTSGALCGSRPIQHQPLAKCLQTSGPRPERERRTLNSTWATHPVKPRKCIITHSQCTLPLKHSQNKDSKIPNQLHLK